MTHPRSDRLLRFSLFLAMLAWAGTWTSAKVVSASVPLELVVFWRFLLTTLALAVMAAICRETLAVPRASLPGLLAAAVAMALYNGLFFAGVRSGLAGAGGVMVTSLSPVLTFVVVRVRQRRPPSILQAVGVVSGFLGAAILLQVWRLEAAELAAGGNLFFLLAAATWTVVTVLSQEVQARVGFLAYSFYVSALATLASLPWAAASGLVVRPERPLVFWGNLLYLSVVGTAFATTVFFRASRRLGPQAASSYMFLVPALAPLVSWIVLGELPSPVTLVGAPLAVLAVGLISSGPRRLGAVTSEHRRR